MTTATLVLRALECGEWVALASGSALGLGFGYVFTVTKSVRRRFRLHVGLNRHPDFTAASPDRSLSFHIGAMTGIF